MWDGGVPSNYEVVAPYPGDAVDRAKDDARRILRRRGRQMVDWSRGAQPFSWLFAAGLSVAALYCSDAPLPMKTRETSKSNRRARIGSLLIPFARPLSSVYLPGFRSLHRLMRRESA